MGEGVLETITTEAPPLPVLCTVIQTQSDGGDAEKSGLWWGKPREAVQAESGHLTHMEGWGTSWRRCHLS